MQTMQNVFTPVADLCQAQLEASRQLADAVFSGTEKIDQVVLEATHRAVNEQLRFAQSMVSVRDAQGMAEAQTTFFSQRPDRLMEYQRELMRVFTEVQSEWGKSVRTYLEQLSNTAISGASTLANANAPASNVYNPFNSMLSAWESAFREASSMATRNMDTARNTFENVRDTFDNAANANTANTANAASTVTADMSEAASEAVNTMAAGMDNKTTANSATRRK